MSRVRTFARLEDAQNLQKAVHKALALPRTYTARDLADGTVVEHGGGRHVPISNVQTTDHGHVTRNRAGTEWAYPVDRELRLLEGRVERVDDTDVTISAVGERDVDTSDWTRER